MKGANVYLNHLPKDKVYLRISERLKNKLSNERKKRFKNLKELSDMVGENEQSLINFFWQPGSVLLRTFFLIPCIQ